MQLRELRLTGPKRPPAFMKFVAGANVISGLSDTGKSYILRSIDYVLGAEKMTKKINEDEGYDTIHLEFCNAAGQSLTLTRRLSGGDIRVHYQPIDQIQGDGDTVVWKRQGTSTAKDVTSVFLPFAGIHEAYLRRSKKGKLQRLTVRTMLPAFLVDENSIIAESSPIYGGSGYDQTARKRMLSYMLTGLDDTGVISAEHAERANAAARAKLVLISELLGPIEKRLSEEQPTKDGEHELTIDRADETINRLSSSLAENREERERLQAERNEAIRQQQSAAGQVVALDELLSRYALLDERYESDLKRLDFIAEGSHFLGQLQEARCPLCDQPMAAEHRHRLDGHSDAKSVYEASKAEAAKILGLRTDLKEAIVSLNRRRAVRLNEQSAATAQLNDINTRIDKELAPALRVTKERLDGLFARRLQMQSVRSDIEQAESLRVVRSELEKSIEKPVSAPKDWAQIDTIAVRKFCDEIEAVLKEWTWPEAGRVEFDEKNCDINVDGKPRISHGKGVRALLHAAFSIGLLRFCIKKNLPHPGFLVLDSPLTSYKEGRDRPAGEDRTKEIAESKIDPTIENGFWVSLKELSKDVQIVVLDNKEPPSAIASIIDYTYFGGTKAARGQRIGFIPS
jgi:hypothetical protein